jgi:hypothetical protein
MEHGGRAATFLSACTEGRTHVKRIQSTLFSWLCAGLVAPATACTLVQDFDVKQCSKDKPCSELGEAYADYECVSNVCVQPVDRPCSEDVDCQDRGAGTENNLCENMSCVAPECTSNEACIEQLNTDDAVCTNGRCEDPVWGCLFDGHDVPTAKTKLTVGVPVIVYPAQTPAVDTLGDACLSSPPNCPVPIQGNVEPEDGRFEFTLQGVSTRGFGGFLRFQKEGYLPLQYRFFRPLLGDLEVSTDSPLVLLQEGTIANFGILVGQTIDEETSAMITMRFYDCTGAPAAGLRVNAERSPMTFFYKSNDRYEPTTNVEATDEYGIGGLANLSQGDETLTVVQISTGRQLYSFPLTIVGGTFYLAFVHAKDI